MASEALALQRFACGAPAGVAALYSSLIFNSTFVIRASSFMLGHQIVRRVEEIGEGIKAQFKVGDRVGIPWLGWTDGECAYCRSGRENLCDNARFTGYTIDGGYAEFTIADARYCFHLPERYDDVEVAPLLCAGLIGYRS